MANAVIKRKGKFYIGSLEIEIKNSCYGGYSWNLAKPVEKLSDVKEASDYITLAKWLKKKGHRSDLKEEILESADMESIYILERPIDPTPEEFEDYWWSEINEKCENCIKACKQSSKVIVQHCPQRMEKNGSKN